MCSSPVYVFLCAGLGNLPEKSISSICCLKEEEVVKEDGRVAQLKEDWRGAQLEEYGREAQLKEYGREAQLKEDRRGRQLVLPKCGAGGAGHGLLQLQLECGQHGGCEAGKEGVGCHTQLDVGWRGQRNRIACYVHVYGTDHYIN